MKKILIVIGILLVAFFIYREFIGIKQLTGENDEYNLKLAIGDHIDPYWLEAGAGVEKIYVDKLEDVKWETIDKDQGLYDCTATIKGTYMVRGSKQAFSVRRKFNVDRSNKIKGYRVKLIE